MQHIVSYADLEVYKKAYAISLEIHKASLTFPKIEQYEMASQMRRASKSVCANLAEGFAKQRVYAPDFARFVHMAIASCDEMKVWLQYATDLGYIDAQVARGWAQTYTDIAKMLHGLLKNWQARG
jgi:four helix bundle protein